MSFNKEEVKKYISQTKLLILATIDSPNGEAYPAIRTIGGFASDGFTIYFSTSKDSEKIKQIESNSNVAAFFQHEGQEISKFRNVAIIGKAKLLTCKDSIDKAASIISDKNPRFRRRVENGEIDGLALFEVVPKQVKYLDFSRGHGSKSIQTYLVETCESKKEKRKDIPFENQRNVCEKA